MFMEGFRTSDLALVEFVRENRLCSFAVHVCVMLTTIRNLFETSAWLAAHPYRVIEIEIFRRTQCEITLVFVLERWRVVVGAVPIR